MRYTIGKVSNLLNCSRHCVKQWVNNGVLSTDSEGKIISESLMVLQEGVHYLKCRECGAFLRSLHSKHLEKCSGMCLEDYKIKYPNALHSCTSAFQMKSEASKALMQTDYREVAANHLRSLNQEPEQKEFLREFTTERWEEGGDLREIVPKWHEDNKELSNQLAFNARKHIKKKRSKLHLGFKQEMVKEGLDKFKTEYEVGHYHIDEARPDLKLSVEVDGCYWHSCPICELEGPKETLSYDNRKESYLSNRGWTILRFWGHEIKADSKQCILQIKEKITQLKLEADRHE